MLVNPSRGVTNDSFIFELPWEYTQVPDLQLRAVINPYGVPLEPTLGDNVLTAGPFAFQPTPRLNVIFVEFPYRLNNTDYATQGTYQNVNWIRRVYPLGASIGVSGWNFGLQYAVWQINDAGLAARINRQFPECEAYVVRDRNGMITTDNRELCASDYVNGIMRDLRSRRSVPADTFLYGEIPDSGIAGQFPRGQAGGSNVSSGPDSSAWNGFYAGHELGHSLGLGHPATANGSCGLAGSDPQPPHGNGRIGPGDSSIVGFDSRDGTFGGARAVLPDGSYFDIMAYCQPQWISDVNYERIYNRLTTASSSLAAETAQSGDWLSVYGSLDSSGDQAAVSLIRRLSGELLIPARVAGDYSLRLFDAGDAQLAEYAFTPEEPNDAGRASFGVIVPFVAGAQRLAIVRLSSAEEVYARAISANPPTIGAVALQGAPDPTATQITLAWDAADVDGDALSYDVLFSRDGGSSFVPLLSGLRTPGATINVADVGGGSRIFRVLADDGVHSAESDSDPIELAAQAPRPQILAPIDGTRLEWGQLVSLRGEAADAQDGAVADNGLSWSNQDGALGSGPQLAVSDLPVGLNVITLTATNSAGLASSTSISITVGDDLSAPGPILVADPAAISWNTEAGSSDLLSAALNISNGGGGIFKWTAASDSAWLSVSTTAGSDAQTIMVSADPSGQPANSSTRAKAPSRRRSAARRRLLPRMLGKPHRPATL
ncbi:MAG: BACON domain-containing protein [Oscillochloris sp.]|nr:BACON domain-containing protein [Oscillochloris sp.]